MKIRFDDARDLAAAAAWAARHAVRNPASGTPTLSGLLLGATDAGAVSLAACDYEAYASATVPATVGEPGTALTPGRFLADLLGKLAAGTPVDLTADGSGLDIACGSLRAHIPTMAAEDFPAAWGMPPEIGAVGADVLRDAVARAAIAASRDTGANVELTAVGLEPDEGHLTVWGTDRYRAAMVVVPWVAGAEVPGILLPPAAALADLLKSATGDVSLHAGDPGGTLGLSWPGHTVALRLLDGRYPHKNLRGMRAETPVLAATLPRAELLTVLDRVGAAADAQLLRVGVAFGDELTVAVKGGRGDVSDTVAGVDYGGAEPPGATFEFNIRYLEAALGACAGDRVTLGFGNLDGANPKPISMTDDGGYWHLLMPLRSTAR